ncbi:MAG: tRNA pseudouridine(38-40) synthase TruA [Buchnera aphidicola (Periphyllus lyropictus)]|uniref:tRNA pseudouridine(38-40) synthase TruA n=1 Tax=Buchnera aphidicola TaxID=9 RepID=UPI001EBB745D|nr:tRNA pseudouridine(38-40) synthase TruA [Buchnera aphidicola]NIH16654.1 tRNA pseudouridine(38-40) synthase TruA [Buchnera aphidicola (Periphyllus lyropictus)]USS94564.1 tRNA pseudouridine(38-40) synthase TruA [Buchnera aphidicola (Periphyllus lyropictus)]
MFKIVCGIEYNGSRYYGWESQIKNFSIKNKLEEAISKIANHKVYIFCAGRTDSGVHAYNQVIHFTTYSFRKRRSWIIGINSLLPKDISIIWIKYISHDFHARYSAISRSYRYIIYNNFIRSALLNNRVNNVFFNLNEKKMHNSGQILLGEHDFSSFRASGCQSFTAWRNIINLNVYRKKKYFVIVEITANSFLYKMVRNIVGCLIEIGKNKKKKSWLLNVLNLKNRNFAGPTVLANGLYLFSIKYPKHFNI